MTAQPAGISEPDLRAPRQTQTHRLEIKMTQHDHSDVLAELAHLRAENQRLNDELIRARHGHSPGPGQCEKYRCAYCRYCGQEKPCSCYTADGRFRGFSIAAPSPDPLKKDFIEGAPISAVSTIAMLDADGYETAVGLPLGGFAGTGKWHPVERYTTTEEAIEGHARWLALAPTLTEVTDLGDPSDPDSVPTHVDLVAEMRQLSGESAKGADDATHPQ